MSHDEATEDRARPGCRSEQHRQRGRTLALVTNAYVYADRDGSVLALDAPTARPLRWAAWRPDGAHALLVGNRGQVLRFDGARFDVMATDSAHNLRGVAWAPDGGRALLVGNRGAVLAYDGKASFTELPPVSDENLRRVAWAPDGSCALIVGNAGVVLRFDAATGALQQLPGDRAHTMRSIAWRPDGAYALIGGYASRRAGYPRPHMLYRCDGRYAQGILATDDEDDAVAIDWRAGGEQPRATVLVATYSDDGPVRNKIVDYTSGGVRFSDIEGQPALLGFGWHPDGGYALACGESGALLRAGDEGMTTIATATRDNLVGPFWQPRMSSPIALMLKGPDERVYTI